ncbi:MAG TPA: PQQ-dependent sugar dehydrogenase, partial [Pseudobdellovibrionaceae bacterium]|nr:PQQ-dependent sugar dehydrogenase [Pseudobdellovibrionaceae bacterium]
MKKTWFRSVPLILFALAPLTASAEKNPPLPPPFETPSVQRQSTVIGWPEGVTPKAPEGYTVELFAELESPRLLMALPSGDILVSQAVKHPDDSGEKSPDKISLLKIRDGKVSEVATFLEDLHLPFGMAVWKNQFFVGEPEAVKVFPYDPKTQSITGPGRVIAELPFPKPQRHWTRDLRISPDGSKLYVSVGSVSNVGEGGDPLDPRTAAILEMNLDGSEGRVFAGGVRNAVTMAFHPETKQLWVVVNERDELGDDLVPDYLTAPKEGGFYGWPYAYWGPNEDPRRAGENPELVAKTLRPDFSVGAHTASLGLTFTMGTKIPAPFDRGALIA